MKQTSWLRSLIIIIGIMATLANAATTWNPAANGIMPPATGNWNTAANWSGGVPGPLPPVDKAVFNGSGAADCIVSDAQTCALFAQGDNGPGGVIRVIDGGSITTGVNWSAIGYNHTARMIVETGGNVTIGEHLWVGFASGGEGVLDIEGGTVNVTAMLGLGWEGGVGYANIKAGTLNLNGFSETRSINGDSVMDIESGIVLISGNQETAVEDYRKAGKITAYGGTGQVYHDYNSANPGKTTIWAEPAPSITGTGDVNGDTRVNIDDVQPFAAEWLEESPDPAADFTSDRKVDLDDFQTVSGNWRHNEYSRTLTGKIMCGYQGWFNTPGDGANRGWVHWGSGNRFEPGYCTVDWWPDMSEYDANEKFVTGFRHADNSPAYVFSSYNEKTVLRHFDWMRQYGIDGVFLQRFVTETSPGSTARKHRDQVMRHCRKGGNQYHRVWAMMYDLSGLNTGGAQRVIDDWKYLVDTFGVSKDPTDAAYLHHNGKPVIAIWGLGFGRAYEGEESYHLIEFLKNDPVYGGCTVMLGVNNNWRTNNDTWLQRTIQIADIISPWAVGRYGSIYPSELNNFTRYTTVPDKTWCDANGKDYLPVVFPGFSWQNLQQNNKFDQMPRLGGRFLWRQYYKVIHDAGVTMIYQAMFDEVDEGTAIFKCTPNPPVAAVNPFLPTGNATYPPYDPGDANLPSDHYLWLAGQGVRMLNGKIPLTETPPTR